MPLIIPDNAEHARDLARDLLDAADHPSEVVTETGGRGIAFRVSDDLARKVGYLDDVTADPDAAEIKVYPGGAGGTDPLTPFVAYTAEQAAAGLDQPAADTEHQADAEPPARNASRDEWAAWLDAAEPPIEYPADARRDELIALWDARQ